MARLDDIDPVVPEKKENICKIYGRTGGPQVIRKIHLSLQLTY